MKDHAAAPDLPHSREAEQIVLGAAFLWPEHVLELFPDDPAFLFYEQGHADLAAEMLRRRRVGQVVSPPALAEWAEAHPLFRDGALYLVEICDLPIYFRGALEMLDFLRELAERRAVLEAARAALDEAADDAADPMEALERAVERAQERSAAVRASTFSPTPFQWKPPAEIAPRQWLYDRHLIRGFASLTVAPGGLGKSTLAVTEALAMVTGRDLLGAAPLRPLRVWLWNGEDPREEIDRRIAAVCLHHGIAPEEIGDRLLVDSGRDLEIKLAKMDGASPRVAKPVAAALVDALRAAEVDVLIVDPFVTSHDVPENDTTGINAVAAEFRRIADAAGCAVELVHHVSKAGAMQSDEFGIYASRGAGALVDAVRAARYLTRMSEDEGARFGVEAPASFFRVTDGKSNLAPPEAARWRQIKGVALGNGSALFPDGDVVGVIEPWTPPDAFEGLTARDLQAVQRALGEAEEPARHDERADAWAGHIVAEVLGLDAGRGLSKAERTAAQNAARARVRKLLADWIASGALRVETGRSRRDGRDVRLVVPGEPVRAEDISGGAQ